MRALLSVPARQAVFAKILCIFMVEWIVYVS